MLQDFLEWDLEVLFCGTAAGRRSAEIGSYYAGRGNRFWSVLSEVGLVSQALSIGEEDKLLSHKIGLTDLVKNKSGMDRKLSKQDFAVHRLVGVVHEFQPRKIAFNGKKAGQVVFGKKCIERYGKYHFSGFPEIWILPSTSGAARAYWDIEPWRALAVEIR
ncbi:mismatch-specific DNA-glycosylase [Celeribacter baekdonensis]|uniref:Mismatch-specific DNA-glycosylase n=1 Tax=Celeribacter baekdonensis TaxID=875171 RepID=A0A2R4M067_9RHOB|nr:mismatch-specific DNA-glycosylase [Celeribacter baekdonensis]AVW90462.1 mismatch-specific DNA-glycosylase [Celeribacter baekdonensis]